MILKRLFPQEKPRLFRDLGEYSAFVRMYVKVRGYGWFSHFEVGKDFVVDLLYKKRGRYARPFLHFGTIALVFLLITAGPIILQQDNEEGVAGNIGPVLNTATAYAPDFYTLKAEEVKQYRGGEIITHVVEEGETLSSIAIKYGLRSETILWENNLTEKSTIKPGQELRVLPVDGVRHKVARGETIYSIAKRYGLDESQAQVVVDYPFNEFLNDETFELTAGQYLMVPDGVKPTAATVVRPTAGVLTPDAGSVSALGSFIWPTSGQISQAYRFYHKALDISNRGGGPILAADSGVIVTAGWPDNSGYGNRVTIDHGNGYVTLYAHMSAVQVREGQRVNRGDIIGQMGSTGRSTGTHLHFEIRQGGALLDPSAFLR